MTLSSLAAYPAPLPLPPGYERHQPSAEQTARAMRALAGTHPWARLGWPELIEALVALGRTDIPLGRLVEGHVDAIRILAQAQRAPIADARYAVWASQSQATGIAARAARGGWRLDGTLRFASGVGVVDRALVSVLVDSSERLLLDLDVGDWSADESAWQTTAMAVSRSHTIVLTDVCADASAQVGPAGFYLGRPGFFPGGAGVAAVWAGGAARLADLVHDYVAVGPPSPVRSRRLGQVRTELAAMHAVLVAAGPVLGTADATGPAGCGAGRGSSAGEPAGRAGEDRPGDLRAVSTEVRAGVAAAVRRVVELVRDLAGPAGRAYAQDLTHAIDDLDLYVRQQNPDTDSEYLGDLPR